MSEQLNEFEETHDESRKRIAAIEVSLNDQSVRISEKTTVFLAAQTQALVACVEATAMRDQISAVLAEILAAKTKVTDDQVIVATKSAHIEAAQEHAAKVRGDLDQLLTATQKQASDAEGANARAKSAEEKVTELLANVRASKAAVDVENVAFTAFKSQAETATATLVQLASVAKTTEERVNAYEMQLVEIKLQSDQQLAEITGLLPGATSAGLAHAFDQRRQSFMEPTVMWQRMFLGSVVFLIVLASSAFWHVVVAAASLSYDEIFRLWLARLPVAGAALWLALHSARETALAKRLEEDYGYKSAIAASFQGFHKQMSDLGTQAGPDTPLGRLCTDTLATIASPPGRIYDKHELTVTPADELALMLKNIKIPSDTSPLLKS